MKKTELNSLIREEIKKILKEEKQIPFKFNTLDMFVGKKGKYIYVIPKSIKQYDNFRSYPGAPHIPSAIESMLDKKGIKVMRVSAPSNVPGFAFVTKESLEAVANALATSS